MAPPGALTLVCATSDMRGFVVVPQHCCSWEPSPEELGTALASDDGVGPMKRHLWLVCNLLKVHYRVKIFLTKSLLIRKIVFSTLSVACCCRKTCHAQGSGSLGIKNPWLFYFRCGVSHAQTVKVLLCSPGSSLPFLLLTCFQGKGKTVFFQLTEAKIGMWESG